MDETHYFYSTDGTDALGPVTHEEFCQLIRDQVIGSESFFCYEGETEWRSLDPDIFVRPPGTTRLPPYEPPPYVPRHDAKERDEERIEQLQNSVEEPGPYATGLSWAGWLLAIGGMIVLQKMRHHADGVLGYVGAFTIVGVLPYLISRVFRPVWRIRVCLIAMVIILVLAIIGQTELNSEAADAPPTPDSAPQATSG